MKKLFLFLVIFCLLACQPLLAQTAKVIDLAGDVTIRKDEGASWQKAKLEMYLEVEAEVKTGSNSECTLAFDEELDNTVTIQENSQIRIDGFRPANVYLPKGRVFSLIDDMAKIDDFQVRTPTAVAGIRGTGESVEFEDECTIVKCFKGSAYAGGFDAKGGPTATKDLPEGFGVRVCSGGRMGDIFNLDDDDFFRWNDFKDNIDDLKDFRSSGNYRDRNPLRDLSNEGRQNSKDDLFEDFRQELEKEDIIEPPRQEKPKIAEPAPEPPTA